MSAIDLGKSAFAWLCIAALLAACDGGAKPAVAAVPGSSAAAGPAASGAKLPAASAVRYVRLEEVTEWNGKPWASVAEFNLLDGTGAVLDRKGWTASADSATQVDPPSNAIDGNVASMWHTPWEGGNAPPPPHALTIDLGKSVRVSGFRYLGRQDKTVNGTIAQYRFYTSQDGMHWGAPVAAGNFADMGAPSVEKTVVFAEQTVNHPPTVQPLAAQSSVFGRPVSLFVEASDPDGDTVAYSATGLPAGVTIDPKSGHIGGTPIAPGTYPVNVSVADDKGATTVVAFGWSVLPPVLDGDPPKPGEVRFVKLEEVSEINGKPWASVAEFNLLDATGTPLARKGWVASADSVEVSGGAQNAIDGDPGSVWHTQWDGASPPPPHSLIVDLGHAQQVHGFRYLPRQDSSQNGVIAKYRFYVSENGVEWGKPVAEGDFSTMGPVKKEKQVTWK